MKRKSMGHDLEEKRQLLKAVQQKMQYKKVLKGRLAAKEGQLVAFKRSSKPLDLMREEAKMKAQKRQHAQEVVKLVEDLRDVIVKEADVKARPYFQQSGYCYCSWWTFLLQMEVELLRLQEAPKAAMTEMAKHEYEEEQATLSEVKIKLGEEEEQLRHDKMEFSGSLKSAQTATVKDFAGLAGGSCKSVEPPTALAKAFEEENVHKFDAEQCIEQMNQAEGELEVLDDVDPKAVKEFTSIKTNITEIEEELEQWNRKVEEKRESIEVTRKTWMDRLTTLVVNISSHFSKFFKYMGYAGEVQLSMGSHPDDFANYGFDVLVKFRDRQPLQRLDPFKQSGGERSVSTACYMMALQSLTKVPFRCVDEINQGMDAKNERKVFDLLIENSVREHTAQYFLLTPKLLPDLRYERGVNIMIVYNGKDMCDHTNWNMSEFLDRTVAA